MKRIEPLDANDAAVPAPPAKPAGKVFDVMRPGTAAASPTSRPVIVSDKPQVQDPSITLNGVGDRRTSTDNPRKIEVISGTRGKPIEVPNEPDEPAPAAAPVAAVIAESAPAPAPEKEVEALAEVAIEGMNEGQKPLDEAALGAEPLPQIQSGPAVSDIPPLPADALGDDDFPRAEPEGVVIANPAQNVHVSIWRTIVLILFTLLLAAAIVDVLLDAQMLDWDLPHTNFIDGSIQ